MLLTFMFMNRRVGWMLLFGILLMSPGWTQQTAPAPDAIVQDKLHEEVKVELVNVSLTATDWKGHFVIDLKPQDLTLKENGIVQQITHFSNSASENDEAPLTIAFLIDTSTSMNEGANGVRKIDIAKDAVAQILKELRSEDKMILLTFNRDSFQVSELTSDKKQLEQALLTLNIKYGRTALFDSIYTGLEKIKNEWGRKIMVICSDGQDNASTHRLDEVLLGNLNAADITVLALGTVYFEPVYSWPGQKEELRRAKEELQRLANETGGFAYFPSKLQDANKVTEKLREIIRSQYFIGYTPTNLSMDGSWRKIEISCKRSNVKLRYREGYYAN
jgi:Ca-activated chloride channel family protein